METKQKKRFFTNHSKSSAMVVSLALHAVLLVVALSFVAVTVVTKGEKKFESRQVNRPRMPPKKLQVPVKIKKQRRKPKLRQRIVVKTKVRNMPDIKMPEISGIKGGLGAGVGAGLGDVGGVGFSMPEIEVFGVRSKGEKVLIALDSDARMMRDEVGGMRAYTIIKEELAKIIEGLSPTTLFNLAVFDHHNTTMLFPRMVPATRENVARVEKWLEPLNKVSAGMSYTAYGPLTLGPGGTQIFDDYARGKLRPVEWPESARYWYTPAAIAMEEKADTIFLLTGWWGVHRYAKGEKKEWSQSNWDSWNEKIRKARELHKKENDRRAKKGEPPQVLRGDYDLVGTYFPNAEFPPEPEWCYYNGRELAKALQSLRKETASKRPAKSGLTKHKSGRFSVNVIFFAPKNTGISDIEKEHFRTLTGLCNGELRVIKGLAAIESSVSAEGE